MRAKVKQEATAVHGAFPRPDNCPEPPRRFACYIELHDKLEFKRDKIMRMISLTITTYAPLFDVCVGKTGLAH